ncbi:MAG: glycosyltransferase, partial [Erysipelotrichaceae bacterium]|nr:glycosyltransferase [Erysipelotrichaceae bacterium]
MKMNKLENIKLSFIIPVYNVEKYLCECIDSIVNQIKSECEIILINDGSTDSSGKICDEYDKKYSFVKTFHKENTGVADSRNFGLK